MTARHEHAIAALLATGTVIDAAAQVGIGESTLRRWLREPEFRAAYAAARQEVLDHAVAGLQGALAQAVAALRRNLDASTPPAVQVRAAVAAFELVIKAVELLDHDQRLVALEQAARAEAAAAAAHRSNGARPLP